MSSLKKHKPSYELEQKLAKNVKVSTDRKHIFYRIDDTFYSEDAYGKIYTVKDITETDDPCFKNYINMYNDNLKYDVFFINSKQFIYWPNREIYNTDEIYTKDKDKYNWFNRLYQLFSFIDGRLRFDSKIFSHDFKNSTSPSLKNPKRNNIYTSKDHMLTYDSHNVYLYKFISEDTIQKVSSCRFHFKIRSADISQNNEHLVIYHYHNNLIRIYNLPNYSQIYEYSLQIGPGSYPSVHFYGYPYKLLIIREFFINRYEYYTLSLPRLQSENSQILSLLLCARKYETVFDCLPLDIFIYIVYLSDLIPFFKPKFILE